MKKVFLIFLVVLMALALVACKQEQEDSGGDDSGSSAMPVEKEAGQEALYAKGQSGTRAIGDKGFRIVVSADTGIAIDVGGKNDVFWIGLDSNGDSVPDSYNYFADIGDKSYWYGDPDGDETTYSTGWYDITSVSYGGYSGAVKEDIIIPIVDGLLYMNYNLGDGYSAFIRGDDETHDLSGRECAVYNFSYSTIALKMMVDKECGFLVSFKYVDGDTNFLNYNMTVCDFELESEDFPDSEYFTTIQNALTTYLDPL